MPRYEHRNIQSNSEYTATARNYAKMREFDAVLSTVGTGRWLGDVVKLAPRRMDGCPATLPGATP